MNGDGSQTAKTGNEDLVAENRKHPSEINEVEGQENGKKKCNGCSRNAFTFTLAYGFVNMVTHGLSTYISSQITTLERQFGLSSSESGMILICNDIGFLLTVLFFGHFGPRFHIPRLLSVAVLSYGISGVLCSLPQFISGIGMPINGNNVANSSTNNSESGLCRPDGVTPNDLCTTEDKKHEYTIKWVIVYFGICFIAQGVSKSPRSSLGTLYIDNNVEKTRTGFYLAIPVTIGICGPFLAFLLAGWFGQIPVDLKETSLLPTDSRWLGAWWIGFVLFGSLGIIASLLLLFYPRKLKSAPAQTEDERKKLDEKDKKSLKDMLKSLPCGICQVFRSPVYDLCLCSVLCLLFAIMGGSTFGPKYIENQFNIPTWKANIILGAEQIATGLIGTFLGGYITSRLRMDRRKCLKMVIILGFITTSVTALDFVFGCENPSVKRMDKNTNPSIQNCHCGGFPYQAVCGMDKQTYITPCHAGCKNVTDNMYGGCEFVTGGQTAIPGICDTGCKFLYPYVSASMISTLTSTMSILPLYLVFLRSVNEENRALGFSILSATASLFVLIPAPVAFGKLYDSTCLIWKEKCGVTGACGLYDIVQMRYKIVSIDVGLRACSLIFTIVAFVVASKQDKDRKDNLKGTEGIKMDAIQENVL